MSLSDLIKNLVEKLDKGEDQNKLKEYLLDYIRIIDNTNENWYSEQFENNIPNEITKKFNIETYYENLEKVYQSILKN